MSMGAFWLLFLVWSYTALPVYKARGSMSGGESLQKTEVRYKKLKSYCTTLGLASGEEATTSDRKTTLFVGEHADLSNIYITTRMSIGNEENNGPVGYNVKCTYPRWSGSGSEDYKKLIQDLNEIIREEN
jgi:hypothetical protein